MVEDNGPGIPKEFHANLFDPFTQLDSSLARRHGGVGLGLAIVHRLVRLMNGTLSLESTTGRGTRFEIALPLSPCPPPHQPSAGGPAVDLSSLSVLVVEDNPINRRVVTTQLGKMEVGEVLVAEDGAKALELASNRSVDLILLDCQMPGLDGFEVARLLREDPGRYGQPIIVALTAHALSEERRRCLEVGMNDFLSKPLSFQNLREALEKWVSGQA